MNTYKLLTPGPLSTTDSVKRTMLFDHCTWDDEYKQITTRIRNDLLELGHVGEPEYTAILMQGSGTFGVESVITSAVGVNDKLFIVANGTYGKRMAEICDHAKISYLLYTQSPDKQPDVNIVTELIQDNPDITHVSMVHGETTSGILNNVEEIGRVAKENGKVFIVDAMSTFGGVDMPLNTWGIDFMISSANKCIQGVPGFSFIIAKTEELKKCEGRARSLALDLYDQWKTMSVDGKWRYTSPTHVVLAFEQALKELKAEGGIPARNRRYAQNQKLLVERLKALGFEPYLDAEVQGPVITSFYFPKNSSFTFEKMYAYVKRNGYVLYPGKATKDTFRIGNIGEIYPDDIEKLAKIMSQFLEDTEV